MLIYAIGCESYAKNKTCLSRIPTNRRSDRRSWSRYRGGALILQKSIATGFAGRSYKPGFNSRSLQIPDQPLLRRYKILQHGLSQQLGRQQALFQQEVVVFPLIESVAKGHLYFGA